MNRQPKKRKKKGYDKKKINDQFGVLVAYLDDQFDVVIEGQQGLAKQIDNVDNRLEDHVKESDFKFRVLGDSLNDFKKETRGFQKETRNNFKIVLGYLSRLDDEIQFIKADVKDIKKELKRKADLERVLKLEVRLAGVEKDLKRYKIKLS